MPRQYGTCTTKNQVPVHSIEMVQWRAARWVLNRYHNTSVAVEV